MRVLSRSLDAAADHVGDAYLLVLAVVAVGSLVAGAVYLLATL